jgi:hypothetical protein
LFIPVERKAVLRIIRARRKVHGENTAGEDSLKPDSALQPVSSRPFPQGASLHCLYMAHDRGFRPCLSGKPPAHLVVRDLWVKEP